jgi:hypothetical protein
MVSGAGTAAQLQVCCGGQTSGLRLQNERQELRLGERPRSKYSALEKNSGRYGEAILKAWLFAVLPKTILGTWLGLSEKEYQLDFFGAISRNGYLS